MTYDLDVIDCKGVQGVPPDILLITVTQDEVESWLELAQLVEENDISWVVTMDNRGTFKHKDGSLDAADFTPDFQYREIRVDSVIFSGTQKHSGGQWRTVELPLPKLAADFGFEYQPSERLTTE